MPADADAAIDAICAALANGRIPESRLDESLKRRTEALHRCEKPCFSDTEVELETATDRALCMELIDSSLEVQGPLLSQHRDQNGVTLIQVDSVLPCAFLNANTAAITTPEHHGYQALICHDRGIEPWSNDQSPAGPLDLERLGEGPVFLQLFLRGNPFRAGQQRQESWAEAIQQLLGVERLSGLAVYGCPYRWDSLRKLIPDSIPAGYSPGQMPEAQQQLLNRMWGLKEEAHERQDFTD